MTIILKLAMLVLISLTLSACATSAPPAAKIERKYYGEWEKGVGYAQAIRVGNTLYLSGVGSEGATLVDQLDSIYTNIGKILVDYNATTSDIVKEVIYTTAMDQLAEAIPARKAHFKNDEYPTTTWLQVERLFLPHMLIEVEVIVQIPE